MTHTEVGVEADLQERKRVNSFWTYGGWDVRRAVR